MRRCLGRPIVIVCIILFASRQKLYYAGSEVSIPCLQNDIMEPAVEKSIANSNFNHDICVVTMTGAFNYESRRCQRETCHVNEYEPNGIVHRFAVGMPSYDKAPVDNHRQGKIGTEREVALAKTLLREHEGFKDILMTPHRDFFRDLSEKRLGILKFGIEQKCRYTFKVDEEFCMNVTVAREMIAAHERDHPHEELYIGNSLFYKGSKHLETISRPGGEPAAPYMSGWLNGVSNKLSSYIVGKDWTHSVLRLAYGTSSEDVNLGLWVDFARNKHNVSVNYVSDAKLKYDRECKMRRN